MISWAQRWGRQAVRWAGEGGDLLFPPRCPACRAEDDLATSGLCERCAREFARDHERCPRCGAAAAACRDCRRAAPAWDGLMILGGYADALREAILRVKRPGGEDLARALATLLVEKQRARLEEARLDAVAPVPMHWWRRAQRGTSAAEEIARAVAGRLRVPVTTVLLRARPTRMQNELPAEERAGNVAGAFRVRGRLDGRRILLVDDVVTTGATLAACAAASRGAGAAAVHGAALARADRLGEPSPPGDEGP
ncbi:MAG: ComF family protein [Planctomycetia bacterium]|nr:ComF family protein [Planctomycetia bacterium]